MAQIVTDFDNPLEEDIVFEETEELLSLENTLKHSENIMKSFLYLRKMFGSSPIMNKIIKVSTVEATSEQTIVPDAETNVVMIKNLSDQLFSLKLNGGELVLLPYETFDFPLEGITTISFTGHGSIIETKFILG